MQPPIWRSSASTALRPPPKVPRWWSAALPSARRSRRSSATMRLPTSRKKPQSPARPSVKWHAKKPSFQKPSSTRSSTRRSCANRARIGSARAAVDTKDRLTIGRRGIQVENATMKYSAVVASIVFLALSASPVYAADTGLVRGTVTTTDGTPIAGASIALESSHHVYRANSDTQGAFAVDNVEPGSYDLVAAASHYRTLSNRVVGVSAGQTALVDIVLARVDLGAITALGTVSVNGRQALSTASAPSVDLDPQDLAGQGIENLSDILSEQIALTMTRPAGGAPGLPQSAALRGPDPSETVRS